MSLEILATDRAALEHAASLLRRGLLVAFPTETVYGLGADAANPEAVARIFAAKGRPADHPVIVHLPDAVMMLDWAAAIPAMAEVLADAFWPGPLTLIVRRAAGVSDVVTGGQDTVGLRVPNHPVALALLREFGGGLAAPSANRFGHVSPTCAEHVMAEFGDDVAAVINGGSCRVGVESTIVDVTGRYPRLLRPGMIREDAIAAILDVRLEFAKDHQGPRASGRVDSHYAPNAPLERAAQEDLPERLEWYVGQGRRVAVLARREPPSKARPDVTWIRMPDQPAQYARVLYAQVRNADQTRPDRILVEIPPETPAWNAVHDRLRRSASG